MIADFYTKPLQGSLFKKHRDWIMNVQTNQAHGVNEINHIRHRSVLGNNDLKDITNKDMVAEEIKHCDTRESTINGEAKRYDNGTLTPGCP